MKVTEDTKRRATEVLRLFKVNPKVHWQAAWFETRNTGDDYMDADNAVVSLDPNICNTTMCVAGAVQWFESGNEGLKKFTGKDGINSYEAIRESGELLGLEEDEWHPLFYDTDNETSEEALQYLAVGNVRKFTALIDSL